MKDKFCPNCGQRVKAGTIFCPNCGHKFTQSKPQQQAKKSEAVPNQTQKAPVKTVPQNYVVKKPMSAAKKAWLAIGIVVIILLIGLVVWGHHYYNQSHQVNRIMQTMMTKDGQTLASSVITNDPQVKVTPSSVKSLISYYQANPGSVNMVRNTLENGGSIKGIRLVRSGTYWLIFPRYKLSVPSYSTTIVTNHPQSRVYVDGQYVKTATAEDGDYQAKVGPYLAGQHSVAIKAPTASDHSLSTQANIDLWSANNSYDYRIKTANLAVLGPVGARVYLDNHDEGKINNGNVLDLDTQQYNNQSQIHLTYRVNGKSYTSNEASVSAAVAKKENEDNDDDNDDGDSDDALVDTAQQKTDHFSSKYANVYPKFNGAPDLSTVNYLIKHCFQDTQADVFVGGANNQYYPNFKKMSYNFNHADKILDWEVTPDVFNVYPIGNGTYACQAKIDYLFDHEDNTHIQVASYPHMTFKMSGGEYKILSVGSGKIIYDRTKDD